MLNEDKICEKNTSFDRPMIKLWEPVVRIIFYEINFALNSYKTCAVSMSDTGKQQFTANQSIYQLSDKDCSVPDDMICDVVFGLVYYITQNASKMTASENV